MFSLIEVLPIYIKVIHEWEKMIQKFNYNCHVISKTERIYEIEDSLIIYLGMIDYALKHGGGVYQVVFEELLENNVLNFSLNAFLKSFTLEERNSITYKRFHGIWNEPIRKADEFRATNTNRLLGKNYSADDFSIESKCTYVDEILPQIQLKQRYIEWEGTQYFFIVYELHDNNRVGYAITHTKNPFVHKYAIQKANDVEYECARFYALRIQSGIDESNIDTENDELKKLVNNGKYVMRTRCDWNMLDIMCSRIKEHKANHWEHKRNRKNAATKWCIAEHDLKYFIISKHLKGITLRDIIDIETEILNNASFGKYDKENKYEYLIPEYRWKSEQLVYEYTKKLYCDRTVIYQHKPFYLRRNGGQMSYDVFVCGLNIAIEYQGKQHFEPVELFGGELQYKRQIERDRIKMELSRENGVIIVYINYWEDISPKLIKEKIDVALLQRKNIY